MTEPGGAISVEILPDERRHEWQSFLDLHHGNICQRYEWRSVLEGCYGLRCLFLVAREGTQIVGLLPLAVLPWPLSDRAISLPYCNYGGLLLRDEGARPRVLQAALAFLKKEGICRIELREFGLPPSDTSAEVTLVLDLPPSVEALWKSVGDKVRNQIRKARRAGLKIQWGADQARELYDIYAANMGRMGTPVHAKAFIDETLAAFGERADILTVRLGGQAIGAMLLLKHDDAWGDSIASSRREFSQLNPNMLMYCEALQAAILDGAKRFDFGRSSRDSGTYRFKRQWGADPVPLNYHTYVDGVRVDTAATAFYRGRSAARMAMLWSWLPRAIQLFLGPKLRRYMP